MKGLLLGSALWLALAAPASAALKVGDTAPDFTAIASLGGKDFTFHLDAALRKGPAVVYFYPSAYTTGCDVEAHAFAETRDKFDAAGASIIGVSADNLQRLNEFASDPDFCAGKFPIASDESLKIAKSYKLQTSAGITRDAQGRLTTSEADVGAKDLRGRNIGHGFIERATFVVGKDHKIIAVMTTNDDKITADQHVERALAIVQRIAVQHP